MYSIVITHFNLEWVDSRLRLYICGLKATLFICFPVPKSYFFTSPMHRVAPWPEVPVSAVATAIDGRNARESSCARRKVHFHLLFYVLVLPFGVKMKCCFIFCFSYWHGTDIFLSCLLLLIGKYGILNLFCVRFNSQHSRVGGSVVRHQHRHNPRHSSRPGVSHSFPDQQDSTQQHRPDCSDRKAAISPAAEGKVQLIYHISTVVDGL